jgi:hypothetical protein
MYYFIDEQLRNLKPSHADLLSKRSLLLPLMLWMSIFNNIMVPFIAMAIISPACFYYAFYPSSPVSATVDFTGCTEEVRPNDNGIGFYTVLQCNIPSEPYSITYDPPFQYSFECTSTLLRSFMSIFLYRYILSGAVIPIMMLILKFIQERILELYGWESQWFHLISIVIPSDLRPLSRPPEFFRQTTMLATAVGQAQSDETSESKPSESNPRPTSGGVSIADSKQDGLSLQTITEAAKAIRSASVKIPIFTLQDFNKFLGLSADSQVSFGLYSMMIVFATDIAILLAFGTMFPPLAVVGCATIWLRSVNIQLIIGRLVYLSKNQPYLVDLCKELHEECIGISKMLINCLLSLPLLLTMSWSWFLFDIWGDVVGYYPGVLIFFGLPPIAIIILPLLVNYKQGKFQWLNKFFSKSQNTNEPRKTDAVDPRGSDNAWRHTQESGRTSAGAQGTRSSIVELSHVHQNGVSFSSTINPMLNK